MPLNCIFICFLLVLSVYISVLFFSVFSVFFGVNLDFVFSLRPLRLCGVSFIFYPFPKLKFFLKVLFQFWKMYSCNYETHLFQNNIEQLLYIIFFIFIYWDKSL